MSTRGWRSVFSTAVVMTGIPLCLAHLDWPPRQRGFDPVRLGAVAGLM